jgi:hypothetical protein
VLLITGSCCDEPELKLSDMDARVDFGVRASAAVDFDLGMELQFDGDFAAWSGVAASDANVSLAPLNGSAYQQTLRLDMDDDGVTEIVRWMAFSDAGPEKPQQLLATWQGDKYSFDSGRCYLLVEQGGDARLISGDCQSTEPALVCDRSGDARKASCQVCDEQGTCTTCEAPTVVGCIEEGTRSLGTAPNSGTGATGGNAGSSGGGGGTANGGGSISVEFDSCIEQTKLIARAARSCDHAAPREAAILCEQELGAVNVCFAAVGGADLFGSPCASLDSDACSGVFP